MHEQKTNKIMNHNRTQEDTIENTISINTIHTRVHIRKTQYQLFNHNRYRIQKTRKDIIINYLTVILDSKLNKIPERNILFGN